MGITNIISRGGEEREREKKGLIKVLMSSVYFRISDLYNKTVNPLFFFYFITIASSLYSKTQSFKTVMPFNKDYTKWNEQRKKGSPPT
jgi:hypothetical protein